MMLLMHPCVWTYQCILYFIAVHGIHGLCTVGDNLTATSTTTSNTVGFFVSTAYAAPCAGNATQWNICYYGANTDIQSLSFFAVYRPSYNATFYSLVSGSATMLTIHSTNISNYICRNFTVSSFEVQPGDVIVSCIRSYLYNQRLGVVGKANSAITLRRNNVCGLTIAENFPNYFDTSKYNRISNVVHVQLVVNECAVNNGGCEQNCIDLGEDYNCSCFQGYQLAEDGLSCTALSSSENVTSVIIVPTSSLLTALPSTTNGSSIHSALPSTTGMMDLTSSKVAPTSSIHLVSTIQQPELSAAPISIIIAVIIALVITSLIAIAIVIQRRKKKRIMPISATDMIVFGITSETDNINDSGDYMYVAVDRSEKKETIRDEIEVRSLPTYKHCLKAEYPDNLNGVPAHSQFTTCSDEAHGDPKHKKLIAHPNNDQIIAHPNDAYGVHKHDQIIAHPNDAYGVHKHEQIIAHPNDAYGVHKHDQIIAHPNDAFGVHKHDQIIAHPNVAYAINTNSPITSPFFG